MTVREEWDDAARLAAWRQWHDKFAVQSRAATELILRAARISPGQKVLDLASGSGEPALAEAEAVGISGHVTATDLLPTMLDTAAENARRRGLTNISFQQADASRLPFPEKSFDRVTSRLGLMFVPDVDRALAEVYRVLKPGGRCAFVGWGPREENPIYLTTHGIIARYVEVPKPAPDAPDGYRFAEPGALSGRLRRAGFREVEEEFVQVPWPWPGPPEEAFAAHRDLRGAPFQSTLDKIPPEKRASVEHEIVAAIGKYFDGRQVNYTATLVVGSGARPEA